MKKYTFYLGLLSMIFLTASCAPKTVAEQPVSEAEALEFAKKLEKNMNDRNGRFMDESIQWEVLYNRTNAAKPGDATKNISKSDFRSVVKNMKLGEKTAENLEKDGSFTILRSYKEGDKQHVLYRLYSEEGINYYDFELTKVKGKTGIGDIFIYLSGENISETARELILQVNDVTKKGKPTADEERRTKKVLEARRLLNAGRYKEVIEIVDNLPASMKKIKVFMMAKVMAASRYDADVFEQALAEYRASFPNEKHKMDLMLLDGYITQKKYDAALQSIDNLDKQLGTDPYLDLQRGALYFQAGQPDSAVWYLERLVKNEPKFEDGYSQLIQVYALNGQEEKARELYKECREKNYIGSKTVQLLEENYPSITK